MIYVAADERDVVLLRANVREDEVYVYPINTTREKSKKFFLSMINKMNGLATAEGEWYNTIWANCTSAIVRHINEVTPGRVGISWKVALSGYADEYAVENKLIDTDLSVDEARKKFFITDISKQIGDVQDYSMQIRRNFYK